MQNMYTYFSVSMMYKIWIFGYLICFIHIDFVLHMFSKMEKDL